MARPVKTSNTPYLTKPSSLFASKHDFRPLGEGVSVSVGQDLQGQLHLGKCLQRGQWFTSAKWDLPSKQPGRLNVWWFKNS